MGRVSEVAFEPLVEPVANDAPTLVKRLHAAAQRRRSLFASTDAVRLFDANLDLQVGSGEHEPLGGAVIERLGDYAVLNTYAARTFEARVAIADALLTLGARGVYLKVRARADLRRLNRDELAPKLPLSGSAAPDDVTVKESGMRLGVRLADGLSTGLFLDQRDNRQRVRDECRGARVANLFCYTGSFSVAAGLGGAERVTSVDVSPAVLQRVDDNLRLNELPRSQHRLLKDDARRWLQRAVRRADQFDWIVLDPPSFASVKGQAFSVYQDYGRMVDSCVRLLAPGGRLLAVLNHRKTSARDLLELVRDVSAAARRSVRELCALAAPVDCIGEGEAATKSVLLTLAD